MICACAECAVGRWKQAEHGERQVEQRPREERLQQQPLPEAGAEVAVLSPE